MLKYHQFLISNNTNEGSTQVDNMVPLTIRLTQSCYKNNTYPDIRAIGNPRSTMITTRERNKPEKFGSTLVWPRNTDNNGPQGQRAVKRPCSTPQIEPRAPLYFSHAHDFPLPHCNTCTLNFEVWILKFRNLNKFEFWFGIFKETINFSVMRIIFSKINHRYIGESTLKGTTKSIFEFAALVAQESVKNENWRKTVKLGTSPKLIEKLKVRFLESKIVTLTPKLSWERWCDRISNPISRSFENAIFASKSDQKSGLRRFKAV